MSYFFSTVEPNGLYEFLVKPSKKLSEKKLEKKLSFIFLDNSFFSLKVFIRVIFFVFTGDFLKKNKILKYNYKNIRLGRYILARVLRQPSSHKNKFFFCYNVLKFFYITSLLLEKIQVITPKISAAYIDHLGYSNGVLFEYLIKKKKLIFTNTYPRGLFLINQIKNAKKNLLEERLKLNKVSKIKIKPNKKNLKFFQSILKNPKKIPYMKYTKFQNLGNSHFFDYEYIIYAHSFLDAQLWYGLDGFSSLYEWLVFTIDELIFNKKKIILKAHPNFYNTAIGEMSEIDKMLFKKIKKRYADQENIIIIDQAIKNNELLSKVSKKTILISHHGTALLEGAFLGFKCISSKATFWRSNFIITNMWKNRNSYRRLLKKSWRHLKNPNKKDLYNLFDQLFWNDYSIYGKLFYLNIISKFSKTSREKIFKMQHKTLISNKIKKKIINKISNSIEEVNI